MRAKVRLGWMLFALLSCAGEERDDASGEDGLGGGSGGKQGNDASGGDRPAGGAPVCEQISTRIGACVVQPAAFSRQELEPILGLTVLEAVAPDPSRCSFSVPINSERLRHLLLRDIAAWRLADEDGNDWVVMFALSANAELRPGTVVDLDYGGSRAPDAGLIGVSRDGQPLVFVAQSSFPTGLSYRLEAEEAECTVDPCWVRSSLRLTIGSESVILGTGESGEVGGLTVVNGYYEPVQPCGALDGYDIFLLAGYSTP
jgi:hypothetical protein